MNSRGSDCNSANTDVLGGYREAQRMTFYIEIIRKVIHYYLKNYFLGGTTQTLIIALHRQATCCCRQKNIIVWFLFIREANREKNSSQSEISTSAICLQVLSNRQVGSLFNQVGSPWRPAPEQVNIGGSDHSSRTTDQSDQWKNCVTVSPGP